MATADAASTIWTTSLTEPLAAWLKNRRWFPGDADADAIELVREFPLADGAGSLLVLRAGLTLLHVPVAVRSVPSPSTITGIERGWLVDGTYDERTVQAMLDLATGHAQTAGITAEAQHGERLIARGMRRIKGEQSNTSVLGTNGQPWIAKVLRVIGAGENPDVAVLRALTEAGATMVPRFLGAVTADWGEHGHVLQISEYAEGAEDAWALAVRDAELAEQFDATHLEQARALGATVASLHAELEDAFGSRSATEDDAARLSASLLGRFRTARREAGDALTGLDAALDDHERALRDLGDLGVLQRIHGDLHLGQILRELDGSFLVLDFEGEPLRPISERSEFDSPARDVVGMLRSFDYAASAASGSANAEALERWRTGHESAFIDGYTGTGREFDIDARLSRSLLIDKAVYEVVYELRHRPDWVSIPLAAVRRLLVDGAA